MRSWRSRCPATGTRSSKASDTASVCVDGGNAPRRHRDAVVVIMRPAGQPKESYGDRSFQGIGKTTREAKQAAAKAALTKLRATMPGIKFAPGVIPFAWSDWCRKNLKRGALLEDLLKTLTTKGFHPAKNPGFMEKFLLIRSWVPTRRPFPTVSELQLWEGGVVMVSRHRDAVFMIIRASTRVVNSFATVSVPHRRSCGRAW